MGYETMVDQLLLSLAGFGSNLIGGILAFVVFVAILFIGAMVANLLGAAMRRFLKEAKVEKFLQEHEVHDAFVGFSFTDIVVALLKLYIVIGALGIAAEVVRVPLLTYFATQAMNYLPSLVQGLVILMVGLAAGDYITDRMKKSKRIPFANSVAIVIELFIAYNALVIAMPLLLPAADPSLLIWSFLIVLAAFGLAIGLGAAIAVGLGMKDVVADVAKKHKSKLESLL